MYTVDYFIQKFEAIPENLWCVGARRALNGQRCAHGWCESDVSYRRYEESALMEVFKPLMHGSGCASINNGEDGRYQQPTPKQRILAALQDIKKMQQPQYPDIRKDLAVFEIGDKTDLPVKVSSFKIISGRNVAE